MKLCKEDLAYFRSCTIRYFSESRELSSKQVWDMLQKDNPTLSKRIAKISKKIGPRAYIGRCLLPVFKREGWLKNHHKVWSVNIVPNRCTQCLKPVEEVYLIDTKGSRFCSSDCYDEFESFSDSYECYYDEYLNVFYDFSEIYNELSCYRKLKERNNLINPVTYIELKKLIKYIENVIWDSDYSDIIADKGADGPLAAEIFRMIKLLEHYYKEVVELEKYIQKTRPKARKLYAIIMGHRCLGKQYKEASVIEAFKNRNHRYLMKGTSNTMTTTDSYRRSSWYDALKPVLGDLLQYKNLIECPLCHAVVEEKYSRLAIDDYRYCQDCCGSIERAGGFDREWEF